MVTRILVLSDIHGNWPALAALTKKFPPQEFDLIVNCGDSLVYAPFPNQVMNWLREHKVLTILGNTDKKVRKILKGKSFKKPGKMEKRIMYEHTAALLKPKNRKFLRNLPKSQLLEIQDEDLGDGPFPLIGLYHGSPAAHHEFIFADTPESRFEELADLCDCNIVISGHSHSPYHRIVKGTHFINPGSVGRMFDGDPSASCATLLLAGNSIEVEHFRIPYTIDQLVSEIRSFELPEIYCTMYKEGRKLN